MATGATLEPGPSSHKWHLLYTAEAALLAAAVLRISPGGQLFYYPGGVPWHGGPTFLPALVGIVTAFMAMSSGIDLLTSGGRRRWPFALTTTLSAAAILVHLVPVARVATWYLLWLGVRIAAFFM